MIWYVVLILICTKKNHRMSSPFLRWATELPLKKIHPFIHHDKDGVVLINSVQVFIAMNVVDPGA